VRNRTTAEYVGTMTLTYYSKDSFLSVLQLEDSERCDDIERQNVFLEINEKISSVFYW
jgi:hypothetical protein